MILHLSFKGTDLFMEILKFWTTDKEGGGVLSVYDIHEQLRRECNRAFPSGYTYGIIYKRSHSGGGSISGLEIHCSSESEALMFKLSTQYPFHRGPLNA